ncbi:hypothetical protein FHX69_3365 [Prauserella muralis]|nr:hypothetical protein FHX69_3365 [Prauserella muralis]
MLPRWSDATKVCTIMWLHRHGRHSDLLVSFGRWPAHLHQRVTSGATQRSRIGTRNTLRTRPPWVILERGLPGKLSPIGTARSTPHDGTPRRDAPSRVKLPAGTGCTPVAHHRAHPGHLSPGTATTLCFPHHTPRTHTPPEGAMPHVRHPRRPGSSLAAPAGPGKRRAPHLVAFRHAISGKSCEMAPTRLDCFTTPFRRIIAVVGHHDYSEFCGPTSPCPGRPARAVREVRVPACPVT